jgi:endoglycosylceramidase
MDGCTRQDPAYRPATGRPRFGGAFLLIRDTRGVRAALIGLVALAVTAAPATAAIKPTQDAPLGHEGRWVTDRKGRVVVLHGFNMVYKRPPYHPLHAGFGKDDAKFLARNGFNTIRLGVIYAGVEPEPGEYDDAYLAKIAKTQRMLARYGIYSLVDFHQDMYNERFEGEGWPDWAVQDDGMPAEPKNGFPGNYLTMPALNRAFDHFWANDPGPDDVGLVDRYAAAWEHVAGRFESIPGLLGYDLMNEPWPGSEYPSCISTEGCPAFDSGPLSDFTLKTIEAIRKADPRSLAWYEPLSSTSVPTRRSSIPRMRTPGSASTSTASRAWSAGPRTTARRSSRCRSKTPTRARTRQGTRCSSRNTERRTTSPPSSA